jgi:hypothetical protein
MTLRRRIYRLLDAAIDRLDNGVYRLRALADRIDPGFIPIPLPEPHYDNYTERCERCGGYLATPIASDWSEATRGRWVDSARHVHAMHCTAASESLPDAANSAEADRP